MTIKLSRREWVAMFLAVFGGLVGCFWGDVAALYAFVFPIVPVVITVVAGRRPFLFGFITGLSTWLWGCIYNYLDTRPHPRVGLWEILGWLPLLLAMALLFSAPAYAWQRIAAVLRQRRHDRQRKT